MANIASIQNGPWNTASTWGGGVVPVSTDSVTINHLVTGAVGNKVVAGMFISSTGTLEFPAASTASIYSNLNIEVQGVLKMRPTSVAASHEIRFTNINENNFVGGGMDIIASDVGLWVTHGGRLDLQGSVRKPWTVTTGSVAAGATSYTVVDSTGWQIGDEVVIVPMGKPDLTGSDFDDNTGLAIDPWMAFFEKRVITGISGNTISFSNPLVYAHNIVTSSMTSATYGNESRTWYPEVINLTRNVTIRGTASGRTHVFISNHTHVGTVVPAVHNIQYTKLQHMGPRKLQPAIHGTRKALVSGRYALHFHHCGYDAQNSVVFGCVITECGNRCFVPHESHKITMNWNTTFDIQEESFWWDPAEVAHFITWEDNLMAARRGNGGVGGAATFAMVLGMGDGCAARRNRVIWVGTGDEHGSGAYVWQANSEGVWIFEGNQGHGNVTMLWVWQNTSQHHTIIDLEGFNNDNGVVHGAYANGYQYTRGYMYRSKIFNEAASANTNGVVYKDYYIDAGGEPYGMIFSASPVGNEPHKTNKVIQSVIQNYSSGKAIQAYQGGFPSTVSLWRLLDLINNDITVGEEYEFDETQWPFADGWEVRVQALLAANNRKTTKAGGVTTHTSGIADFAPRLYGDGIEGLFAQYYNGLNFDSLAVTRYDALIYFDVWRPDPSINKFGVHHLIPDAVTFSIRWTGRVEAHYTGNHTFTMNATGKYRMYFDDGGGEDLIIDMWGTTSSDPGPTTSGVVTLTAGVKYAIRLEMVNLAGASEARGTQLFWKSAQMPIDLTVPQSQLFPPSTNQAPTVSVGADKVLSLPTNSTTVVATASDIDGSIASYAWTKISGPSGPTITSPTLATTSITGFVAGTYVYQCLVTDNLGLTAFDQLTIQVNAAANILPTVSGGVDQTITLPTSSVSVTAVASDPDGSIASYAWTRTSGPNVPTIATPTAATTNITGLVAGTYIFRITVTDNLGATNFDSVQVTVVPAANIPPIVNGGNNQTVQLPTSNVALAATASDPDGSIAAYLWTRVSGPNVPTIVTATLAATSVTGLVAGTYVFQIMVTDDDGANTTDTVQVTVLPAITPPKPRKSLISRSRRPL